MRKRHYAQVARLRLETAIIEFEADTGNDDGAQQIAEQEAKRLPQSAWRLQPFDRKAYAPFVMSLLDETEVDECQELNPRKSVDPHKLVDVSGATCFTLLSADLDTGEGDLIRQPWLDVDPPSLLLSDIARDWTDKLEALGLTNLADRLDELMEGSQLAPSDLIRFGIAKKKSPPSNDG